jgi:hypothetical protein
MPTCKAWTAGRNLHTGLSLSRQSSWNVDGCVVSIDIRASWYSHSHNHGSLQIDISKRVGWELKLKITFVNKSGKSYLGQILLSASCSQTPSVCVHLLHTNINTNPWLRASLAMLMRTALFWGVTQRRVVILCRRFGTTYRSHLQGSISPFLGLSDPWYMGPICCPETSVKDYHSTLR